MTPFTYITYLSFCFNVTATNKIYTYSHTLSLHDTIPIFYRVSPMLDRGHVNLHRYHAKLHDTSFECSPTSSFTPICLWRPAGAPPSLWMAQKPPPSASLRPTGRKSHPTPPDSP